MKNKLKISVLITCILLSISTTSVTGQGKTPEKTATGHGYRKEIIHKAKGIKALNIKNKYGNITINGWDKDSVQIVYEINIGTYNGKLASEILDQITINEYISGKTLFIKTVFEEDFHSGFTFSINYHVNIPNKLQTNITTGFGNTILENIQSKISVDAEYGKLFITNQNSTELPSLYLTLNFIEGKIQNAEDAEINLNNCNFNINRINNFTGKTKFSVINVDSIRQMKLNTEIDRYTIGHADSITIIGDKSFCTINDLLLYGHFEINTGGLKLRINKTLKSLTVANIKANTEITLPGALSYLLHGEVKQGVLSHYQQNSLKILRDQDTISFSGEFGDKPTANIIIFNTSSNLNIMIQ